MQVPIGRTEAPGWTRPTVNDYCAPTPVTKPSSWRSSRASRSCAASPRIVRQTPQPQSSSGSGSLHSVSMWRGWAGHELTPSRTSQRVRPQPAPQYQHYQYSTVAQAVPGEASPYSVSSELYKHILPGYYQFPTNTNNSGGSVLV